MTAETSIIRGSIVDQVKRWARTHKERLTYGFVSYFLQGACTCEADREKARQLEDLVASRRREIEVEYEQRLYELSKSPEAMEMHAFQEAARAIDRIQHPELDKEANAAIHFFPAWVAERALDGDIDVLKKQPHELIKEFGYAWVHDGWRLPSA